MINVRNDDRMNAFFRQLLFILVLIAIGLVIFSQLRFFFGSLLGAITLYVVFRGMLFHLTDKWRWKRWAAALALVGLNAVLLVVAGYLIFTMVASEIPSVDASQIVEKFNTAAASVNKTVGFSVVPTDVMHNTGSYLTKAITAVLNTTYSFAANIFMMLVILYFMFVSGRNMECYLYRYAPFKGRSLSLLRSEVKNMIFSNAVGIPLIMAGQALAAMLIYWLLGFDSVFFWGFLTGICGLIPLIGTGLVYVPMAIFLMSGGDFVGGVIMILYGLLVVANVDNVIRIVVMNKYADTHPLVVVFGVIMGIPLFGFWGIIFGPLLLSGFLLLIKIYYVEHSLLTPLAEAQAAVMSPDEDHPEATKPDKGLHKLHAVKAVNAVKSIRKKSDNSERKKPE